MGTREYSSPEQFIDPESVDTSTDSYSLSAAGQASEAVPAPKKYFELGNAHHLYVNNRFPKPPQEQIPDTLYEIICSMLNEMPSERPSANKLQVQLDEFVRESPGQLN